MENLKERFNGENGIHDNYIKMLESLTEILPGDLGFHSKSEKTCFFVDNKEYFLPKVQEKINEFSDREYPSIFPFDPPVDGVKYLTDEEIKEVERWKALSRFLRDNMTTADLKN